MFSPYLLPTGHQKVIRYAGTLKRVSKQHHEIENKFRLERYSPDEGTKFKSISLLLLKNKNKI